MLLAAKYGVVEIVRRLFMDFPASIRYTDFSGKNVVHLAAKYRHVEVYNFLLSQNDTIRHLFRASDNNGNTPLHLAAADIGHEKNPWRVTGPALQLQSEIKWYQMVEDSNENKFFVQYNKDKKLAKTIFDETHQKMLESGREWLIRTSDSCSLLAALIATVAFASATTVPGGNGEDGSPALERKTGFSIFAISSLTALCLSTTSVVAFLSILSSKFEIEDFVWKLPIRLLIGLSSLFFSIVAMLASFCAGHYFMLTHRLQNVVVFGYVAASLPIALFFAIVQIHLYFDLLLGILSKVPTT